MTAAPELTRRQLFTRALAVPALALTAVSALPTAPVLPSLWQGWTWSWFGNGTQSGLHSVRGLFGSRTGCHSTGPCISIYRERYSQRVVRAICFWQDISKQKLPAAIGFWDGKFQLQAAQWKQHPGDIYSDES